MRFATPWMAEVEPRIGSGAARSGPDPSVSPGACLAHVSGVASLTASEVTRTDGTKA